MELFAMAKKRVYQKMLQMELKRQLALEPSESL
jgi:hypothetical protein